MKKNMYDNIAKDFQSLTGMKSYVISWENVSAGNAEKEKNAKHEIGQGAQWKSEGVLSGDNGEALNLSPFGARRKRRPWEGHGDGAQLERLRRFS